MRTTLTIDDDVAMDLKDYAHQHGLTFKAVINLALRQGLISANGSHQHREIDPPTVNLGGMVSGIVLSREDDPDGEIARFLRVTEETVAQRRSDQK